MLLYNCIKYFFCFNSQPTALELGTLRPVWVIQMNSVLEIFLVSVKIKNLFAGSVWAWFVCLNIQHVNVKYILNDELNLDPAK